MGLLSMDSLIRFAKGARLRLHLLHKSISDSSLFLPRMTTDDASTTECGHDPVRSTCTFGIHILNLHE